MEINRNMIGKCLLLLGFSVCIGGEAAGDGNTKTELGPKYGKVDEMSLLGGRKYWQTSKRIDTFDDRTLFVLARYRALHPFPGAEFVGFACYPYSSGIETEFVAMKGRHSEPNGPHLALIRIDSHRAIEMEGTEGGLVAASRHDEERLSNIIARLKSGHKARIRMVYKTVENPHTDTFTIRDLNGFGKAVDWVMRECVADSKDKDRARLKQ